MASLWALPPCLTPPPPSPPLPLPPLPRTDAGLGNLRSSAYEALMDLIKYSAKVGLPIQCPPSPPHPLTPSQDCYPVIQNTTLAIMERLQHVLSLDVSPSPAPPSQA